PGYGYPWWVTGGWGWNIGTRPVRYQPPHRPHGGPVHPPNEPIRRGGFYQPNPVIAVNRIPSSPIANPAHVVGRPITIAGSTIEPLKPLSPRPTYNPSAASGFRSNQGYGNPGNAYGRSTYVPWANSGTNHAGTWYAPAAPGGGYHTPAPSRGYSYSGGSASSHVSSGGGGHVSSGGGGGGHVGGGGAAPAAGGHH
ncbi:MAG: hypothetical protein WBQ95_20870, partial [Terracidiphilus sp.]